MRLPSVSATRFFILVLLIVIVPLLYAEPSIFRVSLPNAFDFPKRYAAQFLALLLVFLALMQLAIRGEATLAYSPPLLPLSLFLAWAFASLIFSPTLHASARGFFQWSCYGIIFISALSECNTPERRKSIAYAAILAGSLVSVISLLQFYGIDFSFFRSGLHRIYSTLGNPNYTASYLCLLLPLGYWGWMTPGAGRNTSLICFLFAVSGTAALLTTASRGGILALSASLLITSLLLRGSIARPRAIALLLIIAVLFVFFFLPSPLNRYDGTVVEKISEIAGARHAGGVWRMMVWRVGKRMGMEHPVMGNGVGTFNILYLPHLAGFLRDPANSGFIPLAEGGIDHAHNDYLETWIELGLPGIALLIWFIATIIAGGYRCARSHAEEAWLFRGIFSGCVSFVLEAFVSYPFFLWASAVTFFALSGLIAAERPSFKKIQPRNTASRFTIGAAALLLAIVSSYSMISSILSEFHLGRGLAAFHKNRLGEAGCELDLAVRRRPQNGQALFFRGLCLSEAGRHEAAVHDMALALKTYSRQAIFVEMGKACGKMGDSSGAEYFLDAAAAMLPRDSEVWLAKGNSSYRKGNLPEAASFYRRALFLNPSSFNAARNLAVTCHAMGEGERAIRAYERAVAIGPPDADLYVNMGSLSARMGDGGKARALWMKALSIDPKNEKALENLRRLERETE